MTINTRNVIELQEIEAGVQTIPDLVSRLNETIVELNFILRSLTIRNLDGEIRSVKIPANTTIKVNHGLNVTPKLRIMLRQLGGGLITDGIFSRKWIELTNSGGSEAEITVLIVKD